MGRGTSKNVKVISQVFTLKNVNIRYLCLFQIKCAIMRCIFDFFYALKEKHCLLVYNDKDKLLFIFYYNNILIYNYQSDFL